MSIAFSRSLRALEQDRDIAALIVLLAVAVLIIAWALWFFFAPITLYETTTQFTVRRDGLLAAEFSPEALTRIRPGQDGNLLPLEGAASVLSEPVNILVMDVPASTGQANNLVSVYAELPAAPPTLTGTLQIAVETVSPFTLIMRSRQAAPAVGN